MGRALDANPVSLLFFKSLGRFHPILICYESQWLHRELVEASRGSDNSIEEAGPLENLANCLTALAKLSSSEEEGSCDQRHSTVWHERLGSINVTAKLTKSGLLKQHTTRSKLRIVDFPLRAISGQSRVVKSSSLAMLKGGASPRLREGVLQGPKSRK